MKARESLCQLVIVLALRIDRWKIDLMQMKEIAKYRHSSKGGTVKSKHKWIVVVGTASASAPVDPLPLCLCCVLVYTSEGSQINYFNH